MTDRPNDDGLDVLFRTTDHLGYLMPSMIGTQLQDLAMSHHWVDDHQITMGGVTGNWPRLTEAGQIEKLRRFPGSC